MSINYRRTRACLQQFNWADLFIEHLGWGHARGRATTVTVGECGYRLTPIAELGGMVVFTCEPLAGAPFPASNVQRWIDRQVGKLAHEHLTIFLNAAHTKAAWLWVKRGIHAPTQARTHTYERGQPGDALLRKLAGIVFRPQDLDADGQASVVEVTKRVEYAFGAERVTKRFYDDFKTEHKRFLEAIDGIADKDDRAWYTSIMLNRLMFIYFIQCKNLLDSDPAYLRHKLDESEKRGKNCFYREFLATLFFEGFAREENQRSAETQRLLGRLPYLNGGLFTRHQLEQREGQAIDIPDRAFDRLFEFFDKWDWELEPRTAEYYIEHPNAKEEINPDVLGYIFEKYINQKEMGAYYTKEDITGYICRNTILPFLIDKLGTLRYDAVHPLPVKEIDPYIYPAVSQDEYLPTETEREYDARKKRLAQIRADFAEGKVATINDFITYNLDIEAFVQDYLNGLTDPVTLRAFYFECLKKLTVLDPTVGSGAFLFAAMNILEPLYEICLDKMEELGSPRFPDFAEELASIAKHPNRPYFIFKSIIVNNLYGVDILEEATEICKLRLFLKLVAQVERDDTKPNLGIEPLPDIDFNIRAGNTLVGYASLAEVEDAGKRSLFSLQLPNKMREADAQLRAYRALQTQLGISARDLAEAKKQTAAKLAEIENALNQSLSAEYGARRLETFVKTHQPFHWYVEFNQIMQAGGFDVIVGNPPYVEYSKVKKQYAVRGYKTEECGNLYAFVMERSFALLRHDGHFGMIVPLSSICTERTAVLQEIIRSHQVFLSHFSGDRNPAEMFDGVKMRLTICLLQKGNNPSLRTTRYNKWFTAARASLFPNLSYYPVVRVTGVNTIPKIGSPLEASIFKKILANGNKVRSFLRPAANGCYYHNAPIHWVRAFTFAPYFWSERDGEKISAHYKSICLGTTGNTRRFIAVLNSSLFYCWFVWTSNCRDLTAREIDNFCFDFNTLSGENAVALEKCCERLMKRYKEIATIIDVNYAATGRVKYEQIDTKLCKETIDQIDRVLAEHYGFTAEELDFIINYDIKYRLGRDAEEESEP